MNNTNCTAELETLLADYARDGGAGAHSAGLSRQLGEGSHGRAIVALSTESVSRRHAAYRIATLADGTRWLARRDRRGWLPVYAATAVAVAA